MNINLPITPVAIPPTRPVIPINYNQQPLPPYQQHQQLQPINIPSVVSQHHPMVVDPLTSSMFHDLVKNEMVNMLNQMYIEMNIKNPLSLDELMKANPSLYNQIQTKAEENAKQVLMKRNQKQQQLNPEYVQNQSVDYHIAQNYQTSNQRINNNNPYINQQIQNPYVSNMNSNTNSVLMSHQHNMMDSNHNNQLINQNQSINTVVQQQLNVNAMHPPKFQNRKRPLDHHISTTTATRMEASIPTSTNAITSMNQQQQQHVHKVDRSHPVSSSSSSEVPPHTTTTIANTSSIAMDNTITTTDISSSNSEQEMKQFASELYVNGFICECPVVIDINRAQILTNNLANNYNDQIILSLTSNNIVNNNFKEVSMRVSKRLQMYLDNALIPPKLPSILFGR